MPAPTGPQPKVYGDKVSSLSRVVPLKNWIFVMLPSESAAEAVKVMVAGAAKTWLFVGAVMLTVGNALTVIETADDVVVAPALSNAFAVKL